MTLAGLITYSGALAIAAAIPGPGVTALVARALGSGFRSSLFMALGLILGDLTYLTAVVLGLALVAQTFGAVFLIIKWAGVTYLCWLAWKFWTSGIAPTDIEARRGAGGFAASFMAGLMVTLGNPKTMIFYLALLPNLIDLAAIGALGYAELVAVTLVVLAIVDGAYVLMAARVRRLFVSPRALKAMNRGSAALMAGAAAAVAAR